MKNKNQNRINIKTIEENQPSTGATFRLWKVLSLTVDQYQICKIFTDKEIILIFSKR